MLRIATSLIYQQSSKAINDRQVALAKVQQQLATGNRILDHADDPVGSARLLGLNEELGRYNQYQRNIDLASGRLNVEDSTLGDAGDLLQRARELTLQANNDTLNTEDRGFIATEIRQLHSQMLNLANTRDGDGEYLFAGFKSHTQPFDASGNYQGDQGQRSIQAGSYLDVPVGDSGQKVFETDPSDPTKGVFATLDTLADELASPSANFHNVMADTLTRLDQHFDNLNAVRTEVGARLKALDDQQNTNSDFVVHLRETISDVGDLDYPEAATRLSYATFVLQAAQQSFVSIQNLSLFNYMR
mgnify:FL=1